MQKLQHDSETLAEGQQVITGCALLYKFENDIPMVMVAKRAATKKFLPGIYEIPGGHLDFGESLEDGIKREVMEELQVEIELEDVIYAFTYVNEIKKAHAVEVIYLGRLVSEESKIQIHPEDHEEVRWIVEEELDLVNNHPDGKEDPEYMALKKAFAVLKSVA